MVMLCETLSSEFVPHDALALGALRRPRASRACSYGTVQERRGVLVGASQNEREEETRD